MLSDDEKARLREVETLRQELREELNPPKKNGWKGQFHSENVKWFIATLAIPLSVGVWGWFERAQSQDALEFAGRREDVSQLTDLLPGLSGEGRQRAIAELVLGHLADAQGASTALKGLKEKIFADAAAARDSGDAEAKAEGAKTAENLANGSPTTQQASAPISVEKAEVVRGSAPAPAAALRTDNFAYLQIYREDQRPAASALRERLRREGLPVLGIENVVATHGQQALDYAQKDRVDIRFYHAQDRAAALSLAPIVRAASPEYGEPTVRDLSRRRQKGKVGTLEVWYPCAPPGQPCAAAP